MRLPITFAALVFGVITAACGPAAAAPTATPAPSGRPAVLRIEVPETVDFADIPRLMALDALREEGYVIETVSIEDSELTVAAMDKNELDLASLGNSTLYAAIQQGAPIISFLDETANARLLLASNELQACADLDGQRLGVNALNSVPTTMLYDYIEANCPGTEPEYLVIDGSGNRQAGLLAGELDAANLDLRDIVEPNSDLQEGFHILAMYADAFPGLTTSSAVARRGLVEEYPETVKDVIRAILEARRQIQDPQVLADQIARRFELEPEVARAIAQTYLDRKLWDVNGRYTPEVVQANLDFLVEADILEPGLKAADVADLSYLEAVLGEIGRQ